MPSKSTDASSENLLTIKSYISPKKQSPETLTRLHDLLQKHPSQREYLSTRDFNKAFEVDKEEVEEFLAFAKEKSWDAVYDKKAREITITISNPQDYEKSNMHCLRYKTTNGDLHLEADKVPLEHTEADESAKPLKQGFIKNNSERIVNKREAAPIQKPDHGHSALEIAEAYNFPDGDGEGQTIGIIELGGESYKNDMQKFFAHYGVTPPKIQISGTPPATNPITTYKDSIEVTSDIQVAGLLAPKAKLVVYYGDSILAAMKRALADTRNKLTVISISWAGSEYGYSKAELDELEQVFLEAGTKGITVVAASGDSGAFNGKNYANVNVPAIFPHVLGCGGTQMLVYNDVISAEKVWNESQGKYQIGTGGGFSTRTSLPAFQQAATQDYLAKHPQYYPYDEQKGRGVPDIAANAADSSGYTILFKGKWMKIGGTSLATPLWAALIARMNQNLGYNLGYFTPFLYELMGSEAFHPIVQGNNNLYVGGLDWNPCTGLGTPNGKILQDAIDRLKDQ